MIYFDAFDFSILDLNFDPIDLNRIQIMCLILILIQLRFQLSDSCLEPIDLNWIK